MVQSVLFFALGFLSAAFLALMIAPAAWRRAVSLTRKRIEATVPLTQGEIQASKDSLRAEFAMSSRRLEMNVAALKQKTAEQLVEINRTREEFKTLTRDQSDRNKTLAEMEAEGKRLRDELGQREEKLQRMNDSKTEGERTLEARTKELEKLGQLYDEASFSSSNRQIELVAREAEIEKLTSDVAKMRAQSREADRRHEEVVAEIKSARDVLKAEKRRNDELDNKLERQLTTLADREEKLERREKELARLRDQMKGSANTENTLNERLIEAQARNVKLEGEHADMTLRLSKLMSNRKAASIEDAIAKLDADREKLEAQLATLEAENTRLNASLHAFEAAPSGNRRDDIQQGTMLREQMSNLAAEVVSMTAMLEGPDSPIAKALAKDENKPAGEGAISLADRVRALRKAASAG